MHHFHSLSHRHLINTSTRHHQTPMLAAATSFFGRTNISQSYSIGQPTGVGSASSSRPSTPGVSSTSGAASGSTNGVLSTTFTPTFADGLWKVQSAYHKVTNKRVSVWSFDKRSADMERLGPLARENALEVLKAEVSLLSDPSEQRKPEPTAAKRPPLSVACGIPRF